MEHNLSTSQPPSYLYQSSADIEAGSQDTGLPSYTTRPESHSSSRRVEHVSSVDDGQGRACWMLRIDSHAPNSKSLPTFTEGEPIEGTVEVNMQNLDHITAVIVQLEGLIVYSAYDSRTFLKLSQTIWQSPKGKSSGQTPTVQPLRERTDGQYSWPFSFTLPSEIQLPEKEAADIGLTPNERLPPSLADRGWHADINYQVVVNIKRSGILRADIELNTMIGYSPATRPDVPSRLRALAYEANTPIQGPDADPEGWKVFPEVHLSGTLFKAVETNLSVSIALPTPLAYPRGTTFPCAIILTSSNKEAIDLLAAPSSLVVQMRRKLKTAVGQTMTGSALQFADDDRVPFAKANWHPAKMHEVDGLYSCTVLGELSLPHNLVPSFAFGQFKCEYVVDVYPPATTGFKPASAERLIRTNVTVTSLRGPGPQPRAYLPSGSQSVMVTNSDHRLLATSGFL